MLQMRSGTKLFSTNIKLSLFTLPITTLFICAWHFLIFSIWIYSSAFYFKWTLVFWSERFFYYISFSNVFICRSIFQFFFVCLFFKEVSQNIQSQGKNILKWRNYLPMNLGLLGFHKTFWPTTKKYENKNLS